MERFGLREEVISFIVRCAHDNGLSEVVLFGSRATGAYSEKSDIDLAISGGDVHAFEADVEERCPTLLEFDFIDTGCSISDELRERIATEGVRLYG